MKPTFEIRLKQQVKNLGIVFTTLFLLRLLYLYANPNAIYESTWFNSYSNSNFESAVFQNKQEMDMSMPSSGSQPSGQRFERNARLQNQATNFDEAVKASKKQVENFKGKTKAVLQNGMTGERSFELTVAIADTQFEGLVAALQKIGNAKYISIQAIDKAGDYDYASARKIALEKQVASLKNLLNKNGRIQEYIDLSEKIYEKEAELEQQLSKTNTFESVTGLCTIQFTLMEKESNTGIGFFGYLASAFYWTFTTCFFALLLLIVFSIFIALSLYIAKQSRFGTKESV